MTSFVKTTRVQCITSGTTQDITVPGTVTPSAAILIATRSITNGLPTSHACIGFGFTDGTNHRAYTGKMEDGASATNPDQRGMTDEVIVINDTGTTVDGEANFSSWLNSGGNVGIQINWGNLPTSAYQLTVIFFMGDISVGVGDISTSTPIDTDTSDSSLGFTPSLIFFMGGGFISFNDVNNGNFQPQFGIATNEASIIQGHQGMTNSSGSGTSNASTFHSNQYVQGAYFVGGGYAGAMQLKSFDANGFTVTHKADNTIGVTAAFLAIKFNDNTNFELKFIDSPTGSSGNKDVTSFSFKPQCAIQIISPITAVESHDIAGAEAGVFGISVFNNSVDEYSMSIMDEDAAATMNTASLSSNIAIDLYDNTQTSLMQASFIEFLKNGWRLNYTSTNATVRKWIALAISTNVTSPSGGIINGGAII